MTEKSTSNRIVLEMVKEVKDTTNQVQGSVGEIQTSLAEIKNEIKNLPKIDFEKHQAIDQRLGFQDEKIAKVQQEIKDLKFAGWGLVSGILILFIKSMWDLIVR